MLQARPLPAYLIQRFHGWRATTYQDNKAWYRRLAEAGQMPRAMIISCCDSRVDPATVFDTVPGQVFALRNVANLVPPYEIGGGLHGQRGSGPERGVLTGLWRGEIGRHAGRDL